MIAKFQGLQSEKPAAQRKRFQKSVLYEEVVLELPKTEKQYKKTVPKKNNVDNAEFSWNPTAKDRHKIEYGATDMLRNKYSNIMNIMSM
jgi:hypothetical protein